MENQHVITAVCHRNICGALVMESENSCYAEIIFYGTTIRSESAKFDLFKPESKVQSNWNAAVDAYIEKDVKHAN